MRKKTKSENRPKLRDRIADSFEVSKEVFLDVPKLTMIGNRELCIENYKGICEYTDKLLIIEAKPCRIRLEGSDLEVKTITEELIYVTGEFLRIEFFEGE